VGIIGLILFVLFNLRATWGLIRRVVWDRNDLAGVLLVVLVTLLGSFAFSVSMLVFPFSLYYWFVLALALRTVTGLEADDLDSTRRQSGVVG
jgi:hypothetical protein